MCVPKLPGISDAAQLIAFERSTCALRDNGRVMCWGWNYHRAAGIPRETLVESPTEIPDLDGVVQLTSAFDSTCARLADGSVKCWGFVGSTWANNERTSAVLAP